MTNLDKIICNTKTIPESSRTKNERLAQTNSKTIPESTEKLSQTYSNTIPESTRTKNERLAQTNSKTSPESTETLAHTNSKTIPESTRTKNERLAQDNKNNECYLCINKKENLKCKVCHQIICIEHATHNKYCIKCYNDKCNYDFYPSPPPMLPNFKHHTITNHTKKQ
jgi:hypothetical protein